MTVRTYIRISRIDEKDILENQRREVHEYVARLGILDAPSYEDVASGADTDRPGWNDLMKSLRAGDIVIFTSLSRMTRGGVGAAFEILRELKEMNVGWRFTSMPILNFDANTPKIVRDVILAVLSAIDEEFRRGVVESTRGFYKRRTALAGPGATVKDWRPPRGPDKRPRKRRGPLMPRIRTPLPKDGASLDVSQTPDSDSNRKMDR